MKLIRFAPHDHAARDDNGRAPSTATCKKTFAFGCPHKPIQISFRYRHPTIGGSLKGS